MKKKGQTRKTDPGKKREEKNQNGQNPNPLQPARKRQLQLGKREKAVNTSRSEDDGAEARKGEFSP